MMPYYDSMVLPLSKMVEIDRNRVRSVVGAGRALRAPLVIAPLLLLQLWSSPVNAATRYVATTGSDSGDCTDQAHPCRTITFGIAEMAGGDTLIVGDGTYAEAIARMPNGSAAAYTTIRAENDWGVLIDGSAFPNTFRPGIDANAKSYVQIRGFRVRMNQDNGNNEPVTVQYSDHIKIQRCSGSYGPVAGNGSTFVVGPDSSYVLIEECYAYGGTRYQYQVHKSHHVIVRRCVARHDYWTTSLPCGGFCNYNASFTVWQNDIVLDSDTANCAGTLYGGFYSVNKDDDPAPTTQLLQGNIVLNVNAMAGDNDIQISGTRTIEDMVIWGSSGGYWGQQGPGDTAVFTGRRMTVGGIKGKYDGPNGAPARGTGVSIYEPIENTLMNSILAHNESFGIADYTNSDYNAFFANGANYGGHHPAVVGAHDRADDVVTASLRYLPRIEVGSPLKNAGQEGDQIGAEIMFKVGVTGSLYGDPGWDQLTTEPLWPFPNEDQIGKDMASYSGPGGVGTRGFATGTSLDGSRQTLTKYVWEYLGNPIPPEIYGCSSVTTCVGNDGCCPAGCTHDNDGDCVAQPTDAGMADAPIMGSDVGTTGTGGITTGAGGGSGSGGNATDGGGIAGGRGGTSVGGGGVTGASGATTVRGTGGSVSSADGGIDSAGGMTVGDALGAGGVVGSVDATIGDDSANGTGGASTVGGSGGAVSSLDGGIDGVGGIAVDPARGTGGVAGSVDAGRKASSSDSSGCGCRLAGVSQSSQALWLVLGVGLIWRSRRRHSR